MNISTFKWEQILLPTTGIFFLWEKEYSNGILWWSRKKYFKSADHVGSKDRLLPWHLYHPWHRLPGDFSYLRHSFLGSSRTWHRPSKLDMFRIRPLNIFGNDANLQRWPSWASLAVVELGKSPPGCLARSVGRAAFLFCLFFFLPFYILAFFSLFPFQFFAFLMIIFFGEVASGVLVYYQVEKVFFKLNAKWCNRIWARNVGLKIVK